MPAIAIRTALRPLVTRVLGLAATFAIAVLAGCSSSSPDERWSAFPHTMGCVIDPDPTDDPSLISPAPPPSLRVERVTMTHPGGQQVVLSMEFAGPPPTNALQRVVSPFTGHLVNAPGSMFYIVTVAPKDAQALMLAPSADGKGWDATKADLNHPHSAAILSVETTGNVVTFDLDVEDQLKSWAGRLTPQVQVDVGGQGPLLGGDPDGGALIFKSQTCSWDSPVSAESPEGRDGSAAAPVQPPAAGPAPGSIDSAPSPTTVSPPAGNGYQIPPDADTQGFLGYPGARCNYTNPAVAIGRTADSAVVICETGVGRFYYKGFGLQNGQSVEIDDPVQTGSAFVATNNGVRYSVSPAELTITQGSAMLSNEPMLEYWSA
jgi:hypothetical protein